MGLILAGSLALITGIVLTLVWTLVGDWVMLIYTVPMTTLGVYVMQKGGERVKKELEQRRG